MNCTGYILLPRLEGLALAVSLCCNILTMASSKRTVCGTWMVVSRMLGGAVTVRSSPCRHQSSEQRRERVRLIIPDHGSSRTTHWSRDDCIVVALCDLMSW